MPRKARLRLAQDCGEIGHRKLCFRNEHEQPQPGGLGRGFEGGSQYWKTELGSVHFYANPRAPIMT